MAQANPFADLIPQQPAPQQAIPGYIPGRQQAPSPIELQREVRAERGDIRADAASRRADEAARRAADAAERQAAAAQRQAAIDERKLTTEQKLNDSEGKGTAYYNSALDAENEWGALARNPKTVESTMPAGMLGDAARAVLPTGVVNSFTSDERQRAQQAKENFIRASLRAESGAAIGKEEFDRQDRIFFPQAGESEGVIAQKARARQTLIQSLRVGAGGGASRVDEFRKNDGAPRTLEMGADLAAAPAKSANSFRLKPEQEQAIAALVQSGAPSETISAVMKGFGGTPSPENITQLQKFYADPKNRGVSPTFDYTNVDRIKPVDDGSGRTGAALRGVADTATFGLAPRLGAVVDTVANGGTYADNLDRNRGIILNDEQQNGGYRLAGQVVGGAALPSFGASGMRQLAALGAGYSGAYAVGSSNEDLASLSGISRAVGAAVPSAAAGGAVGGALGRLGEIGAARLGAGGPPNPGGGRMQALIDAGRRQDVPLTVPDVAPGARGLYGVLESVPGASGVVNRNLQPGAQRIEQRVSEIGGNAVADRNTIGATIRGAGERYVNRSRTVVGNLYQRAERLAGGQQITPTNAVATLDREIADLSRTPEANAAKLGILNRLRADMVDETTGAVRNLDVDSVRNLRTSMRDELNANGLRATDAERRVMGVLDAANQDITSQLTGPALRAYQRADRAHRGRVDMVDNVVKKFIGGRNGLATPDEGVVGAVERMARPNTGDSATLTRMIGTLDPAEREQVASTIAHTLGRRGADGDNEFTPARFFSAIQNYSPDARSAIWGAQGARDLADLARIAEQRGFVMGKMNNSRSGAASNWMGALRGLMAGGSGAGIGAATGMGAGAGAGAVAGAMAVSALTAKALSSRRVVAALGAAARANTPQARAVVIQRLGHIASREPQIANDILPIREALTRAVSSASAEDQKQN